MTKLIVSLLALCVFSLNLAFASADLPTQNDTSASMAAACEQGADLFQDLSLTPLSKPVQHCQSGDQPAPDQFAGQGCCSWHGGECGCSASGRAICCDGTLSPSCGC